MQRYKFSMFLISTAQLSSCFVFFFLAGSCFSQTGETNSKLESQKNSGKITKVTLYRDQALVTREISVVAGETDREISVDRLPVEVVVESVYAQGLGGLQVRGVRVGKRTVSGTDLPEAKDLAKDLESVKLEITELQHKQKAIKKQMSYIDGLMNFSAVSTASDLSRGVLDSKSLTELSQFTMKTQQGLSDELFRYDQQLASKEENKAGLEQQLVLLTANSTPIHHANVTVAAGPAGTIQLSYLVSSCGWRTDYTVSGSTTSEQVNLRYNAMIQQMSGEDWNQVQLTLSTASPSVSSTGPALTPFRVGPECDRGTAVVVAKAERSNSTVFWWLSRR